MDFVAFFRVLRDPIVSKIYCREKDRLFEQLRQLQKHTEVDTPRPPLVPAERNNAVTSHRPRTRDVSSRYRSPSPSPSTRSIPRRCQSPTPTRTVQTTSQLGPKRAQSAERKRPSTPSSLPSPSSTPVKDSSVDTQISSRKIMSGRLPEGLWPSTMRSLSVSFQSDSISVPVSKKEKPVTSALSEHPLRLSSNVYKQAEAPTVARKLTPERKRSPLKGKNASDQSENSKPVDRLHSRLIDQHRWPSRTGGKVLSSNTLARSVDLIDKAARTSIPPVPANRPLSVRRLSLDGVVKPPQKTGSDSARLLSIDDRVRIGLHSIDDHQLRVSGPQKLVPENSLDKTPAVRSQSLHTSLSRPSSPSTTSVLSSSLSRGVSPAQTRSSTPSRGISPSPARPSTPARGISPSPARPSTPTRGVSPTPARPSTPPRGVSPSRIRPSNSTNSQTSSSASVLCFIADFRKGKKSASHIEDAHQLRLVYNRYLQWRFANARADAVLHIKKVIAEKSLYNVWNDTLALCDTVILKRISLQQLRQELKLNTILNGQMTFLDDWALLERDHTNSLSGAVEDFEASTLRLPVTGGARADIEYLKLAVCSAVDVMQAMGSSICSLLSRVEMMNSLVSELAFVALQESDMLDQCEALLASTAAMQVEEYSLRTHLIQMRQALDTSLSTEQPQPQPVLGSITLTKLLS